MFNLIVSYSLCLVLVALNGSSANVAPSYIQTCPGLKSDCLKRVVQETLPLFSKGIPELGVDPIDPLTQDHIHVVLPGGFIVDLRNGSMTGLKKCRIDSASKYQENRIMKKVLVPKLNEELEQKVLGEQNHAEGFHAAHNERSSKLRMSFGEYSIPKNVLGLHKIKVVFHFNRYKDNTAHLKMHCDLTIKGLYKASGRILIVTINGDGNAKIKIKNAALEAKILFEDKVRDGVTYHVVKKIDIKQDYGEKVTFALTNLFQGNKELGDAVLLFLNENWKQIAEEFGKPLVDKLVDIIYGIIQKFFEAVPKDELIVY